jgi:hypothetical protein
MIEVRFHGRGVKEPRSRAAFRQAPLAGLYAQDFALFGAETGAPWPLHPGQRTLIDQRGYIEEPDLVVVMDDSLLKKRGADLSRRPC